MTRRTLRRPIAATLLLLASLAALCGSAPISAFQEATPQPYACDGATPMAGTPTVGMDAMATPTADMDPDRAAELDQLYVDMMIPHHESIVALAQAALPRLTDERLTTIAQAIVDAQTAEVAELRGYRERFYGSADPMPMDAHMMDMMSQAMPGMGSMDDMAFQMDADLQVAAFCAAADPDVAFIDMTIPHHEMAIAASKTAVSQATHPEIRAFAERVVADQQREIDELTTIRVELTGDATPTS